MFVVKLFKRKRVILCLYFFCSCTSNNLPDLESHINKEIYRQKSQEKFTLKLDTISSFEWDELLIATPYSDIFTIDGYSFKKFPSIATDYDQYIFLGFISNKKGVKWAAPYINDEMESLTIGGKGYKIFKREKTDFEIKL